MGEESAVETIWMDQIHEGIIETIRDPLLILDKDFRVITASRSFYEFFKVKPEETVGQFVYDLGNKQWDIPKLRELLETILPQETSFDNYEVEHHFTTIGKRTMLLNARQIEQARGKKQIILLAIEDVTERKRLKDLLEDSEERFRRLFETAADGILLLEKSEFSIRFANPAITEMLGYSNEELIGNDFTDIGFANNIGNYQEVMQTLDKSGIIYYKDASIQKKTGQVVDTDIYMVDKTNLVQCVIRDITERKQAEEQIRFQADIIENAPMLAAYHDKDLNVVWVNRAYQKATGLSLEEVRGKKCYQVWNLSEPCRGCPVITAMETGEIAAHELTPDNQNNWPETQGYWLSQAAPVRDKQGTIIGAIEFAIDITDRKRSEKELIEMQSQHAQMQKMETVGRLAGGIAHDFNNILGVILGHAEMGLEQVHPGQAGHENLLEIHKAAIRSAELTAQLLAFARKQTVSSKVLDLNDEISEMIKMLQHLIGENIDLQWSPGHDIWAVKIDPSQVNQLLMNLCVNAREAVSGMGKVTIETKNMMLDESYCAQHKHLIPGEYVLLSVSDDGCGIDETVLLHIFDPFFTTSEVGKGTGMGLSTVYGIVKQNLGCINVYSEQGQGTTMNIYLPKHAEKATQQAPDTIQAEAEKGAGIILLVDDNLSLLSMTKKLLEGLGYTVIASETPSEAIHLAETSDHSIDLLMTDVVMPEMNGRDLADTVLTMHPDIKLLFMSGYTANTISYQDGLGEGVSFIQKPFSMRDLSVKIRELLSLGKI